MKILPLLIGAMTLGGCHQKETRPLEKPSATTTHKNQQILKNEFVFSGNKNLVQKFLASKVSSINFESLEADEDLYKASYVGDLAFADIEKGLAGQLDFIEPNYVVQVNDDAAKWPRDPEFFKLWALNNLGQAAPHGLEGTRSADINALKAWDITKGSKEIIVGVIDTGVDYTHPDLKDNIWTNQAENGGNVGIDDDQNGFIDDHKGWDFVSPNRTDFPGGTPGDNDPMDDNGHGTHCAGTIGASGSNNTGVVGVNWHVSIMPLKFLNQQGSGSTVDAYRAIRYGTKMGAHILSNSWGGGGSSRLVKKAIQKANDAGVIFVAAAGNASSNNDTKDTYPANYDVPNVISVGASDNRDTMANFSNYGTESVDVFAPGVQILSTIPVALASNPSHPYDSFSGTSMATPHVSGVAALLLAAVPELRNQPAEAKKRLIETSEPVASLSSRSQSRGRIDAYRALNDDRSMFPQAEQFIEEPYAFASPAYPRILTDYRHTIEKPGAKAIRIHFDSVQIDEPYDSAYVYDKNYNLVTHIENAADADFWSPVISGDTVHIRFVNSKVRYSTKKPIIVSTPDEGYSQGAELCFPRVDDTFECWVDDTVIDFYNFNSEGFSIDRIAYIPGEQGDNT